MAERATCFESFLQDQENLLLFSIEVNRGLLSAVHMRNGI